LPYAAAERGSMLRRPAARGCGPSAHRSEPLEQDANLTGILYLLVAFLVVASFAGLAGRGHPKGLIRLYFIEMWERLGFYTMVGILLLYTIDQERGGLGMRSVVGNEIYGLYLAFVYFTPYLGGLIADRFLGYRRSVLIGGILFAAGYFLMSIYGRVTFVSGLVLLCLGNGLFKPNISVMVGNLYQKGDPKRDAGFNIFYMGINIGAFFANYLAATLRNTWGWSAVFLGASLGMLIGVGVLLWSWKTLEVADRQPERSPEDISFGKMFQTILLPAFGCGVLGYLAAKQFLPEGHALRPAVCGFLAGMIPIVVFFVRLGTRAKPEEKPGLLALLPIYVAGGTFFMVLHLNGSAMTTWANSNTDRRLPIAESLGFAQDALPEYYHNASPDDPRPNRMSLLAIDSPETAAMCGQRRVDDDALAALTGVLEPGVEVRELGTQAETEPESAAAAERRRWDDFGIDVYSEATVETATDSHGATTRTVRTPPGAEPLRRVVFLRTVDAKLVPQFVVDRATYVDLYDGFRQKHGRDPEELPPGEYMSVANSELFQSLNALFVVTFTPLVIWFFALLRKKNIDFSTARKIVVGLALTTLSLLVMAAAGMVSNDGAVKVSFLWLVGFYAIVTAGELCLSPMALSLVTKLSPKRLVGLTMGGWFLATAFGNNFSGFFGGLQARMPPMVFFLVLAAIAGAVTLFIALLLPKLDAAIKKYGA
jgi:dipeptide/tripeptide permease